MREAILASLAMGATRTAASGAAGIDRGTLRDWINRDPAFSLAVEKAEAEAEQRFVQVVRHAADNGTWQAAAWWLERRRKDDYAQKQVTQLEGNDEKPIPMKIVGVR